MNGYHVPSLCAPDLSLHTIGANVTLTRRVQQLEEELSVWKQARAATVDEASRDKRQHEEEKSGLLRRIANLEMQQVRKQYCPTSLAP